MAIVQWGFFSVPHLLWHEASFYDGHLRGPVTLTPNAERWQWSCHYLYVRLRSVAVGIRTPTRPLAGRTLLPTAPTPRPCCYWKYALLTLTLSCAMHRIQLTNLHIIGRVHFMIEDNGLLPWQLPIPLFFFDWYNLMYHISYYETIEIYFKVPKNKNKMFL